MVKVADNEYCLANLRLPLGQLFCRMNPYSFKFATMVYEKKKNLISQENSEGINNIKEKPQS